MIKEDQRRYIEHREFSGGNFSLLINLLLCKNFRLAFQFWFRAASGSKNPFVKGFSKIMHIRLSRKYGLQIPIGTKIGSGLYIGHGIGIVINKKTIIGQNCNISHFLTIGSNQGTPAVIGDNVYIGPNVSIVEHVRIGDNAKIGAGTVVINDIPACATSVGNPNRIIEKKG